MATRKKSKENETNNSLALRAIIDVASDPSKGKSDILDTLNQILASKDESILEAQIPSDVIESVKKFDDAVLEDYNEIGYKKKGDTIEVNKPLKYKKGQDPVSLYVKEASKEEARYFADIYQQFQGYRISIANQIRAIEQGADQADNDHKDKKQRAKKDLIDTPAVMAFRYDMLENMEIIENNIKRCLEEYSDRVSMAKYAKQVKGIGPVFATILCANLDIKDPRDRKPDEKMPSVGTWIAYSGLNDNNRPWIRSDEQARAMVNEAIEENGGVINDDAVYKLCAKSQWSYEHYYKFHCDKKTGKFSKWEKEKLVKATKLIPYNANLKKTMYLIGQSFIKNQNRGSLYGELYKARFEYETVRNEQGYNEEYCKKALASKNYSKGTETYKCYVKGKIPKSQIVMRSLRHTVKIFLSHLYAYEHMNKFGIEAPMPYVFAKGDFEHKDYIEPEVPFENVPFDHI